MPNAQCPMPSKMLAFDTSTSRASWALWEGGRCVYDGTCELGRRHSERLFDAFDHGLSMAGWARGALEAIAVGIGPGSFTGLRVGVATAQGLAFALGCPLYGVNSLDAMALSAPAGPARLAICVDARKQELYVGTYRRGDGLVGADHGAARVAPPEATAPTRLMKPAQLAEELAQDASPILMLGSGVVAYQALFAEALGARMCLPLHDGAHGIRGADIAYMASLQAASGAAPAPYEVLPVYIRPSEAEMHIGPPEGGPPLADRLAADGTVLPPTADAQPPAETE